MKEIKVLQKQFNEVKETQEVGGEAKDLSKKIDIAKEKAEEFHDKITKIASKNKDVYKEFTKLSKEINKVKKEQEDAFEKFITFKQEFSETNRILKDKFDYVQKKRKATRRKRDNQKKAADEKKLEEKKEKVEEKIKLKGELTTEDLIAFQGG